MQALNTNAAQPGMNQKALRTLDILVPTEQIVLQFDNFVRPIMKAVFSKAKQMKGLQQARDRLLPKLMSGEITV